MILGQNICERDNNIISMLLFFLEGREAFLTELSLQGKKDSRDYPDNYCFASAVDGGEDEEILQNFTTCLVRNTCSKDILLRFSLRNSWTCLYKRFRVYHLSTLRRKHWGVYFNGVKTVTSVGFKIDRLWSIQSVCHFVRGSSLVVARQLKTQYL